MPYVDEESLREARAIKIDAASKSDSSDIFSVVGKKMQMWRRWSQKRNRADFWRNTRHCVYVDTLQSEDTNLYGSIDIPSACADNKILFWIPEIIRKRSGNRWRGVGGSVSQI